MGQVEIGLWMNRHGPLHFFEIGGDGQDLEDPI